MNPQGYLFDEADYRAIEREIDRAEDAAYASGDEMDEAAANHENQLALWGGC